MFQQKYKRIKLCYFWQKIKVYSTLEFMTCRMRPLDPSLTITLVVASMWYFGGLSMDWCRGLFHQSGTHFLWPSSTIWVTDVLCHIALTVFLRTHLHILVNDVWPLFGTLTHVPCETLAHAAHGTQLAWPTITSSQRCSRTGRYRYSIKR